MQPTREPVAAPTNSPPRGLPWAMRFVMPYLRHEWPMWGRVYRLAGGDDDRRWLGRGRATVRGKVHGYEMELDLGNWSERLTFCLARFHDLPLQLALRRLLRPGDAFVDIGANLGLVTLLASRLVGEKGLVVACEPNPLLCRRIRDHVGRNGLRQVRIVDAAIGCETSRARLHEYAGHSGWGSLSSVGPEGAQATAVFEVPVAIGDEVVAEIPEHRPLLLKIDVEGHEVPVLRGLQRTLAARQPLVCMEVTDSHQRRAGYSAAELCGEIQRFGYTGYAMETRRGLLRHDLTLLPMAAATRKEVDVLFVPACGPLRDRVAPLLAAAR